MSPIFCEARPIHRDTLRALGIDRDQPNGEKRKRDMETLAPIHALSRERLKKGFLQCLPLSTNTEPSLREALGHVLSNPGSLARPEVVFQVGVAYGLLEPNAEHLAIALEYFHTASLLFDDLPCMDDATVRRGATCTHVVFGEASAILAGLAFVNRAYALIWQSIAVASLDRQARATSYIESRLGIEGLLNGQSLDLRYVTLPHDLKTADKIALGKTVSLIRLALVLPALLGGAPEKELCILERIAVFWGLSYQTLDDLKDILQSTAESGKTNSRDALLGRPNIAVTLGVVAAAKRINRLIYLGDMALRQLLKEKPGLAFLQRMRQDLEEQSSRVIQATGGQE